MTEQKTVHLHISTAPDMFHNTFDDIKSLEELAINQTKEELQDEVTLQKLGFKGKPDLSNLKVEYPIPIELQENRRVECRISISVPCLNGGAVDRLGYKPLKSDNIELGCAIPLPDGSKGIVAREVESVDRKKIG